jgi:hypothetical protein
VVELVSIPLVVPRSVCDLTGVVVRYGGVGVTVPASGAATAQGDGTNGGASLTASVDSHTENQTIHG